MITIENADKALKEYYLQAFSAQLNEHISPFYSAIEKSTQNVYGKNVNYSIVRSNAGNIKACAEDSTLPNPHKNRYLSISVPLKNIFGTIEISDKALRASRDSSGAFVNLVNAEMEGLIYSAKQNFQRMLFGDGDGTLCGIVTNGDGNDRFCVDKVKDYFVGLQVDIFSPLDGDNPKIEGVEIIGIDKGTKTIILSEEIEENIDGSTVRVHGAKGNELTGLDAIFSGNELYGHSKADDPYFVPYEHSVGGLSEETLCEVMDVMEECYNSKINMIICSYKTRKLIGDLLADKKRVVNTIDVNTGRGTVSVNGVPVFADQYCPESVVYFINTEDFSLSQLCDWEWLEDESGKILKQIPGKAAYSATLVKYAELICKRPCGQAKLVF